MALEIGIKALLRPANLTMLLQSIVDNLPGINVIVDDTTDNLSLGRNRIVDKLKDDYLLLLDDDFLIVPDNNILDVMVIMGKEDMDIVCGSLYFEGRLLGHEKDLEIKDRTIFKNEPKRQWEKIEGLRFKHIDMGLNFFLAKKSVFKKVRWDNYCDINSEHVDFFLMAQKKELKVFFCPDMKAEHIPTVGSEDYKRLRDRTDSYKYLANKWGVDRIIEGDLEQNLR